MEKQRAKSRVSQEPSVNLQPQVFICTGCQKVFKDKSNRGRHFRVAHPQLYKERQAQKQALKKIQCKYCNSKLKDQEVLRKHLKYCKEYLELKQNQASQEHVQQPSFKRLKLTEQDGQQLPLVDTSDKSALKVSEQEEQDLIQEEVEMMSHGGDSNERQVAHLQFNKQTLLSQPNVIQQQEQVASSDKTMKETTSRPQAKSKLSELEEEKVMQNSTSREEQINTMSFLQNLQQERSFINSKSTPHQRSGTLTSPPSPFASNTSRILLQKFPKIVQEQTQINPTITPNRLQQLLQAVEVSSKENSTIVKTHMASQKAVITHEVNNQACSQQSHNLQPGNQNKMSPESELLFCQLKSLIDKSSQSESRQSKQAGKLPALKLVDLLPVDQKVEEIMRHIDKELERQGGLISMVSTNYSYKPGVDHSRPKTRASSVQVTDAQVENSSSSLAYGEATKKLIDKIYHVFHQVGKMNKDSAFIDVGSGNGKVVYQIAALSGCLSYGMEMFFMRYDVSTKMLDIDQYRHFDVQLVKPLINRVQFSHKNFLNVSEFKTLCGKPITHLYSFNTQFTKDDKVSLLEKIDNSSSIEMIAVSNKERQLKQVGLHDFEFLYTLKVAMRASSESRSINIFKRNFSTRHLLKACRSVMPDIKPPSEAFTHLTSMFDNQDLLEVVVKQMKQQTEELQISKHFLVAITLAIVYNDERMHLLQAQNYLQQHRRYQHLCIILEHLYLVSQKAGKPQKDILQEVVSRLSYLNSEELLANEDDEVMFALFHLQRLVPLINILYQENQPYKLSFNWGKKTTLEELKFFLSQEYQKECQLPESELTRSSKFFKALRQSLYQTLEMVKDIECMASLIPMKPMSYFKDYQIPPQGTKEEIDRLIQPLLKSFKPTTPKQRELLNSVFTAQHRFIKVLVLFKKNNFAESNQLSTTCPVFQMQIEKALPRVVHNNQTSKTLLENRDELRMMNQELKERNDELMKEVAVFRQDMKTQQRERNVEASLRSKLEHKLIDTYSHLLKKIRMQATEVLRTAGQSIIMKGCSTNPIYEKNSYIIKIVPKAHEFYREDEIMYIQKVQKSNEIGKCFVMELEFSHIMKNQCYVYCMKPMAYSLTDVIKMNLNIIIQQHIGWALIQGLLALHSQQIYHRDLKPENVLFDENLVPRISDLGLSNLPDRQAGTLKYFAPEQHLASLDFDPEKVDYWGLGIILFMLVKKREPAFLQENSQQLVEDPSRYKLVIEAESGEDEGLVKLIRCLLKVNPKERDLKQGLKKVVWFNQVEVSKSYQYNFKQLLPNEAQEFAYDSDSIVI